jgi:2'-5' RNA ligase
MRIFTGLKLDDAAKEPIIKELKCFKKAGTPIRWTASGNIHLTLKFIGEVDEAMMARVAAALATAKIAVSPFRMRFSGFGTFPAGEDLHVFWAGVEENQDLRALFAGIEQALLPLGIERETRSFHPHLTLGRNRARFNFKSFFALLAEKSDLFLVEMPVAAFQLFASRLTPAGPVYTILKEIPLVQS